MAPQVVWGQQPGGRGTGCGRGGHSTAGRSTPWGSSSAPAGRGDWDSGPLPDDVDGGNRHTSREDQQPAQSAWASPPVTASSLQSGVVPKGSAPWKGRSALSTGAGRGAGPSGSMRLVEAAFGALTVASENTATQAQSDTRNDKSASTWSAPQNSTSPVNRCRGCEFSSEPQALEHLHNQQEIQELGILHEYDPEARDPSHTQLRIASKQAWDEDRLEKGCEMLNKGIGQKIAARKAGVLLADLKKYWEEHYAHSDSDEDDSD